MKDALYVGASILKIGLYVSCIFTLLAFLEAQGWLFSLTCHMRVQYLALQILALIFIPLSLPPRKEWRTLALGSTCAVLNAAQILPLYFPPASEAQAKPNQGSVVSILQMNVNSKNKHYDLIEACIRKENPDVVVVQEATPTLVSALTSALPEYKAQQSVQRWDNFGLLLLSKLPIAESSTLEFPEGAGVSTPNAPTTITRLVLPHGSLSIMHCHLLNPFSMQTYFLQVEQMKTLVTARSRIKDSLVLIGDLNTTSWCHIFNDFLKATDLKDGRQGFGVQATWPTVRMPLLIPLDHCLVSRNLTVLRRRVGPGIESDHFPVYNEIFVPAESSSAETK